MLGIRCSNYNKVVSSPIIRMQGRDELRRAWDQLRLEARDSAAWLGTDVEHVFTVELEGVGEGSVTGKTRGEII